MASLIKYVITQFGEDVLLDIYQNILNGNSALDAIFNATFEAVELVPLFFNAMIQGQVYNVGQGFWRSNVSGSFDLNTNNDVPKNYSASYPDFGAKIYQVNVKNQNARESENIIGESSSANSIVTAMKLASSNWSYINSGRGKLSIPNLKSFYTSNSSIYYFVINMDASGNYTGTDNLQFEIDVEETKYNRCWVFIRFSVYARSESKTDPDDVDEGYETVFLGDVFEGSLTENIFTGVSDSVYSGGFTVNSTVSVLFSEDLTRMITLNMNDNFGYPEGSIIHNWSEATITVHNVDGELTTFESYEYKIEGALLCDHFSDVSFKRETDYRVITRLSDFCDENSHMTIELYYE